MSSKQELSVEAALQIMRKLKLSAEVEERFIVSVAEQKSQHVLATLSEASSAAPLMLALRESEERYRALFDLVGQTVSISELVRDENGKAIDAKFIRVNRNWLESIGTTADKVIGRRVSEWLPNAAPSLVELYERVVRTGCSEHKDHYLSDLDQWYEVTVVPTEGDRNMVIGTNVTRQRKQEALLRESQRLLKAVFEALPLGIGVFDNAGKLILENARLETFVPDGIDSTTGERWLGGDGSKLKRGEFPADRALRGESVLPGIEMRYIRDDQSQARTRVSAVPLKNEAGEVIGSVLMVTEVSES